MEHAFEIRCGYTIYKNSSNLQCETSTSRNIKAPFPPYYDLEVTIHQGSSKVQAAILNSKKDCQFVYTALIVLCDGSKEDITETGWEISRQDAERYVHRNETLFFCFEIRFLEQQVTEKPDKILRMYDAIGGDPTDFVIQTKDGSFKVSKSYLRTHWDYFRKMISSKSSECSNEVWVVDDFGFDVMQDIVLYIYFRNTALKDKDHVIDLMKAAHHFLLYRLVTECSTYLVAELSYKNVLYMLVLSDIYGLEDLRQRSSALVVGEQENGVMWRLHGYEDYIKYAHHSELTQGCLEEAARQIKELRARRVR
ncbi:Protein maternal effect lethal 26 [Halotydeus destructor]|nr:Protein maternal effect lethal 26 [Halotydeus destructor]